MLSVLRRLKGKNIFETLENWSIAGIAVGAFVLAGGIGLVVLNPRGITAILAMMGAVVAFGFIVMLIFVWIAKEIFGKERPPEERPPESEV